MNKRITLRGPSSQGPLIGFPFENVFMPQRVTLSSHGNGEFAKTLPHGFLLTPHFGANLDLQMDVTGLLYQPCEPPRDALWTVPQVIIDMGLNISIFMNDQDDWLILSGVMNSPAQSSKGTWKSSLEPRQGEWTSIFEAPTKPINLDYFWWTLLIAPETPDDKNPMQTVMLEFEVDGDEIYQRRSLPSGWTVTKFDLDDEGVLIQLISPESRQYCLQGGAFSGEISSMVCNGTWTVSNDVSDCPPKKSTERSRGGSKPNSTPLDGGTWTGTGGGAGLLGHP